MTNEESKQLLRNAKAHVTERFMATRNMSDFDALNILSWLVNRPDDFVGDVTFRSFRT